MAFGSSIPQSLHEAIKQRESLISSNEKTPDIFKFTHQRSSFVVVRSLAKVNGSSDIPKSAVLSAGIGIKSRSGIDRDADKNLSNSEAAYYQNEVYGFRPMPGITNVNSQAIGQTGATRKTTISFKANSKEDLDLLSRTYMNFGIHVIVEFGHTVYLNKSGEAKEMSFSDLVSNDKVFANKQKLRELKKDIRQNVIDKNHSYEGLIGKVSGYDFSVATDGTYDCSLKLISDNHVMDSLSIPNVSSNVKAFARTPEGDPETSQQEKISNLVGLICDRIKSYSKYSSFAPTGQLNARDVLNHPAVKLKNISENFDDKYKIWFSKLLEIGASGGTGDVQVEGPQPNPVTAFVDLRFIMRLFNKYAMPRNSEGNIVRLDEGGHPFTSFSKHFTINPGMVQLPKKSSIADFNVTDKDEDRRGKQLQGVQTNIVGGKQNILDIKVSIELIERVNQQFINLTPAQDDEVGLIDFIDKLKEEVQKYLGKINKFKIATEPESEDIAIYDQAFAAKKGLELSLTGLSTTVTGFSIKSNLSNKLGVAAMMAGSGGKSNGGMSTSGLANSNKDADVEDGPGKVSTSKVVVNESDEGDSNADTTEGGEDIKDILIGKFNAWNQGEINTFESTVDSAIDYLQSLRGSKRIGRDVPVPIELSIEMLGTGGFRNLECFTIPQHLVPERFGNKNFIILNVENILDASDSLWKTSITGTLKPHN